MHIQPNRALHGVIWAYALLHLLIAWLLPLAAHEAHYALYARSVQLSYMDHPPLAAWLQSLVLPVSSADFALRLLPIGLSVVALYLLARLTRIVYPDGSPWLPLVSVLLLQGAPVFHASMTLSPDAPLVPLALGTVLLAMRAMEKSAWRVWLLLGLLLGLAGLAKYTAVTLAVSVLVLVLLRAGWRGFFDPRLWLVGAVSVLVVSPVLWWNWQNDWITVAFHSDYQFEDIERWSMKALLDSLAGQLLFYSPLLVLGGLATLFFRWREEGAALFSGREGVLAVFVLPVLLLYVLTALESRASAHWSVLGWLFLVPLLASRLMQRWQTSRGWRGLTWVSGTGSVLVLVALLAFSIPMGQWPDFQHPARRFVGWEAAAVKGDELRKRLPARDFETEPVILARNWHHAGLLAWYLPGTRVMNLRLDLNPHNFKEGYPDHTTWGVLVYPRYSREPRLKNLTRYFDCTPIDALPVRFGGTLVRVFHFYACYSRIPAPESGP